MKISLVNCIGILANIVLLYFLTRSTIKSWKWTNSYCKRIDKLVEKREELELKEREEVVEEAEEIIKGG